MNSPGFGKPCAAAERHLYDMAKNNRRTVARDLDHIVRRIGVRFGEEGDDDLVETLASGWLDQIADVHAPGFEVVSVGQPQHGTRNPARAGTRDAHHSNAAPSRRRSDGNDGVVYVHGRPLLTKEAPRGRAATK